MFLPVLIVLVIGIILFKLTSGGSAPEDSPEDTDWNQIGTEVLGLVKRNLSNSLGLQDRSEQLGTVLRELLTRLGMGEDQADVILSRAGFSEGEFRNSDENRSVELRVQQGREEIRFALERALWVGIQVARAEDDYAGVGDDLLDLEELARKVEEIETRLFSDGDRDQNILCQKAALVLQDMLQGEGGEVRSEIVKSLLQVCDEKIASYQEKLSKTMQNVPNQERLLWGDSRDRRTYYFKMGVTNSLRRSGRLESLGHLYRYKGVNYDVLEAYDIAAQECTQLVAADNLGIERLLQMGPIEIQSLVLQRLKEGG